MTAKVQTSFVFCDLMGREKREQRRKYIIKFTRAEHCQGVATCYVLVLWRLWGHE